MLTLLTLACTLVLPFYVIYKPPKVLINYFAHRWPDVLWQVSTSEKIIALTIDDAPSGFTDEIVQLLKANEATATFFVIGGQVPGREAALLNAVQNGNELGNHAMRDEASRSLSSGRLTEEIHAVEAHIHDTYRAADRSVPPKYFRPGSGFFSQRMRETVAGMGYRLVLGSVYPHDPQIPFWRVNAAHILSMVRPGAIVICHDRREWTIPMLRKVLPALKKKGYKVVTLTELLTRTRPKASD
jgi:peptidoglycan/xylan/chitin deacetylase (PgdA/CDA1 family)